jgi:hypothetical protein
MKRLRVPSPNFTPARDRWSRLLIREMMDGCVECTRAGALCHDHELEALRIAVDLKSVAPIKVTKAGKVVEGYVIDGVKEVEPFTEPPVEIDWLWA